MLPDSILAQMKPLDFASSAQLDDRLKSFVARDALIRGQFDILREHDTTQSSEEFLASLGTEDTTELFLSWDFQTAIKTTWSIFRSYWDDFCYPASDDVGVTPLDDSWLLCYHHEEMFEFGIRKSRTSGS